MQVKVLPRIAASPEHSSAASVRVTVAAVLLGWLALIVILGAGGSFVSPLGTTPVPIAIGVAAPLGVFLTALWLSHSFRGFVSTLDLRLISAIQAWRFAGLGFLALYAHHVLPGSFALPAGLGDIAIGVTAPWIVILLIRRSSFAAGTAFTVWNALGVLDLVVAIATGALGTALAADAPGEITTQPMALLPLVLIPVYLVPVFLMLHTAALIQARHLMRGATAMPGYRLGPDTT